jgi:hypothetical protein
MISVIIISSSSSSGGGGGSRVQYRDISKPVGMRVYIKLVMMTELEQ